MAQKKRQDAGLAKLKKELSENNLGNLYLFYGEEDYLRDYYIQQVQKKLLTEGMETCSRGKSWTSRPWRTAWTPCP